MRMTSFNIATLFLPVLNIGLVYSDENVNCNGKIKIFDGVNKKFYLFSGNDSSIDDNIEINPQSYVLMTGEVIKAYVRN